jgi:hypothetical protein
MQTLMQPRMAAANLEGETTDAPIVITVTALTAFGALVASAQAENLQGAPMQNGN